MPRTSAIVVARRDSQEPWTGFSNILVHLCFATNQFNFDMVTNFHCLLFLVTSIEEVFWITVMGGKLFHVMVSLEDMVEFMDANIVRIRVLVCQV